MPSSASAAVSSAPPEGDTTLALATMIPYSSDGPTLPLIGGAATASNSSANRPPDAQPQIQATGTNGTRSKKQKLNNGAAKDTIGPEKQKEAKAKQSADLSPLYKPWTLLPPEILRSIEARCGGEQGWDIRCIPVVFTRNQNIKSGINRLKAYLGYEASTSGGETAKDVLEKLGREDVVVAVSAQGEGTTKLVGIVEMAKRVVQGLDGNGETGGGERSGGAGTRTEQRWYLYTSLASRVLEQTATGKEKENAVRHGKGDGGGETEMPDAGDDAENQGAGKSRKVPVLTAWLSKKSIPEFKKAFGEQIFQVRRPGPIV
jgi:hypothetical protein